MNVEIGNEAAQFPEKEHINGNFVAVQYSLCQLRVTDIVDYCIRAFCITK